MSDYATESAEESPESAEPAAEKPKKSWVPSLYVQVLAAILVGVFVGRFFPHAGLWQASAGRITFRGEAIQSRATPDIAQAGIAYVPESMGIFADLTVQENMVLAARSAPNAGALDGERLAWIFDLFPALKKFWLYPAGKLSGGQKQMLAVARAICEPRALVLIDEPSKGLAPAIIQNLIGALHQLKAQRTTILLVEQNFPMACALGDSVAVMDDGRVVHRGAMRELAEDESLQQRLLGLSLGAHA